MQKDINHDNFALKELSPWQKTAFFAMIIGMFMAILDIQIVASSLPVIAAGLSASDTEMSLVQTSYLIAEVIIIPLTGFLAKLLSIRIAYFIAAVGFTFMSFLCSIAWNIESMVLFRSFQGLFGGIMIPTVFSTLYLIFPPSKRANITIVIGLVVTIAPTLGPTLGGYISEYTSWHFMFLINLLPGVFVASTVFLFANFDKPNLNLLKNFDIFGCIFMAVALACLQYVLEEGSSKGWFDDSHILFLAIISFLSLLLLLWRVFFYENPVINLQNFRNKNFSLGCFYSFILGAGLFGAIYLMPVFLFTIAGFDSLQIGITMIITGVAQFCSAPVVGNLMKKNVDLRIILSIGIGLFGFGCYINGFLTADSAFNEFIWPQIARGFALMFCMIPVNNIALGNLSKDKVQDASGLYNLTRNLGGAIGLALISTNLTSKTNMDTAYLSEQFDITSSVLLTRLEAYKYYLDAKVNDANAATLQILYNLVKKEAFIIAINDLFRLIGMLFIALTPLSIFADKVNLSDDNAGH